MAANLTPSEYRDSLVNAQEFKGRFTFPTQRIFIEPSINGSPGRAEYQLIIGNDADFHIQAITGGYSYLYSTAQANSLLTATINALVQYNSDVNSTTIELTPTVDVGDALDMVSRLRAFQQSIDATDNWIADARNMLISIQDAYSAAGRVQANLNDTISNLFSLPITAFHAPHAFAQDNADDLGVRLVDGKSNRNLTEGFVPLELILSPGSHGNPLRLTLPFSHVVQRNSYLRMEFLNHTPTPAQIELAFHGTKFYA